MKTDDQFSVMVDKIIGQYMIRFNRLDQLIPYAYEGSKSHAVNLYVDMYSFYKTIFSRSFRTNTDDYLMMTSALVNLCSFYRSYFFRLQVYPKIFLISSFNVPDYNTKMVAGYNKTMVDKLTNSKVHEMVELNIGLVETLVEYLKDVHFISTSFESSVLIRHMILDEMKRGNYNPNIILSKDPYPLQLVAEFPGTTLLRPKKVEGDDISEIVYPIENKFHLRSFWNFVAARNPNLRIDATKINISPINLPLFCALSQFPERNIKAITNATIANDLIYSIVGDQCIKLDLDTLYNTSEYMQQIPQSKLESRYRVLDASGFQFNLFESSTEPTLINLNNLSNPEAITMINATYFQKEPLNLQYLT